MGYAHDFCNLKVRENQTSFTCIAHNFFKFGMFFLLKGVRISVWNTKDINIGGNRLTNINFVNFGSQVKFSVTVKYYLTSLGKLASTMDEKEKKNVEKTTIQFLVNHSCFSIVWNTLPLQNKTKILEIIVSGKGVIPYEKIISIKSMKRKPKDEIFFTKDEFYSILKEKINK